MYCRVWSAHSGAHFLKPPAQGRKEIGMKLVPMLPQMYRFVGEGGEQLHSHGDQESLPDPKIRWSWCNLQELWDMLESRGMQGPIQGPGHLIQLEHQYAEEGGPERKRLYVAVDAPAGVRFLWATRKTTIEVIQKLDSKKVFVPAGWAQAVVMQLSRHVDPILKNRAMVALGHALGFPLPGREWSVESGTV